jgi:hypothetical protein
MSELTLIQKILEDVVIHLKEVDPHRTLTARKHISKTILQLEQTHVR